MHLLPCLFLMLYISVSAQVDTAKPIIFGAHPEIPAQFPGGDMALLEFVKKNVVYPSVEVDTTVQIKKVVVRFTVTEEGKITAVRIQKSAGKPFDDEAVRVVKLLPDFEPGSLAGKRIKMDFILPVVFRLPY